MIISAIVMVAQGERSMHWDEDAITTFVAAARNCLEDKLTSKTGRPVSGFHHPALLTARTLALFHGPESSGRHHDL
ncbi:MAG: hypothetical protein R2875_01845 [Desulfobacterales bacterium]